MIREIRTLAARGDPTAATVLLARSRAIIAAASVGRADRSAPAVIEGFEVELEYRLAVANLAKMAMDPRLEADRGANEALDLVVAVADLMLAFERHPAESTQT
ncbi:MAG: hypothetical protein ACHQ01_04145 [Candidatus Limnocylindrales bacterium]